MQILSNHKTPRGNAISGINSLAPRYGAILQVEVRNYLATMSTQNHEAILRTIPEEPALHEQQIVAF